MTHYKRRYSSSGAAVKSVDIRAAYSACFYSDKNLVGCNQGFGNIFVNKLVIFLKYKGFHHGLSGMGETGMKLSCETNITKSAGNSIDEDNKKIHYIGKCGTRFHMTADTFEKII